MHAHTELRAFIRKHAHTHTHSHTRTHTHKHTHAHLYTHSPSHSHSNTQYINIYIYIIQSLLRRNIGQLASIARLTGVVVFPWLYVTSCHVAMKTHLATNPVPSSTSIVARYKISPSFASRKNTWPSLAVISMLEKYATTEANTLKKMKPCVLTWNQSNIRV